jgi:hypothetical protein
MSQRHRALGWAILAAATACAGGSRAATSTSSPAASSVAIDPAIEAVRRQVVNGSIIADVQLGRVPPMAVGACVDPVASARFELDRSLDFTPDHPPVVVGVFPLPPLPASLRDSEVRTGVVTARWVVDTSGTAIPGSVSIVASPHGLMSAQVCGAVLIAHFTPATDDGRRVRARVEMPVRFVP